MSSNTFTAESAPYADDYGGDVDTFIPDHASFLPPGYADDFDWCSCGHVAVRHADGPCSVLITPAYPCPCVAFAAIEIPF